MDGSKIDLITLVSIIIFVVALFKMRSVLGRRTETDDERVEKMKTEMRERQQAATRRSAENVVTMPRRQEAATAGGVPPPAGDTFEQQEERIRTYAAAEPGVVPGLLEILKYDSSFDPDAFAKGAKQAYEMIVTAFAEGNRKVLKDLLSRDVYEGFSSAIAEREQRGEVIDQSFVGINKADITEASVKNGVAVITVRFVSQLISATRDRGGVVISGDPQRIKEVTDVWTFNRDVGTPKALRNLNWRLIATQGA